MPSLALHSDRCSNPISIGLEHSEKRWQKGNHMIFEKVHRTCRRLCFTGTAPLFTLFFLAPSHSAQTVTQRETSTAQLHTLEIDAVPTTATDAIRPFHFNAAEEGPR